MLCCCKQPLPFCGSTLSQAVPGVVVLGLTFAVIIAQVGIVAIASPKRLASELFEDGDDACERMALT